MAKFKPAGSSKKAAPISPHRGLIPCGLLILAVFALVFGMMYLALKA
jgi:hypothetical protein